MTAIEKRWTDLTIKSIKPRDARFEAKAPGFPGLRLLVHPSGTKTFIFRYTFGATYKKLTLNAYVPDTGALAAAATHYKEAETELHNGRDPADLFKRKRSRNVADDDTVTAYLELYRQQHVAQLAVTTQDYVKRELNLIGDKLGPKDIRKVTQDDVQRIIDGSIKRKGRADGLAARNQTYKVAKQFFAWTANRAGIKSPCTKIEKPADDNIGERVLDDDEIKIVWGAATKAGPMHGGYVKLLLLTGCRRDEIAYLRRHELKADTIELPGGKAAARTKNRDPHSVPLTWLMRRVLAEFPKGGDFVVTGNGTGLGGHTKARDAIETPDIPWWTFHDLRRTVTTGLARLGVPLEVAERCLNHRQGVGRSQLQRIYNKHTYEPEIKAAFEKWTDHVAGLVGEKQEKAAA